MLIAALLALVVSPDTNAALTDQERMTKLARTPATVFPDFELAGSRLIPLLNARARPGDAVVLSATEAFKGDFRVSQLGVTNPDLAVWLHVSTEPDLRHAWHRQTTGIKGLVFIPAAGARGRGELRSLAGPVARLRENAASLGLTLSTGLEEPDLRLTDNMPQIARSAHIVTLYLPDHLRRGGNAFSQKFQTLVEAARAANPAVQIELAIPTGLTPEATQALGGLVFANIDSIDRVAIYCADDSASFASLEKLLTAFRPN